MARKISVGIGIGTYQIKVVVTEDIKTETGERVPQIIGIGSAESRGLRHGYIINIGDAVRCVKQAVAQAEKTSGIKIKRAYIGIGGIGLSSIVNKGVVPISRADSEITEYDIKNAIAAAENDLPKNILNNKKILNAIPINYKIDNEVVMGRPIGMKGTKLEAKVLFVLCIEQHLNDLITAVENAGIEVADVAASPLAASIVNLSKTQKMAGCVLVNIGAETVSLVVYENNVPISLEVFPIGSADITNDIALGFRIPIDEAENIKTRSNERSKQEKKKLDEIVSRKLSDIFNLVEAHLKKIGRNNLLPAGIVLTGGGSLIDMAEELAKSSLKLPSKIASVNTIPSIKNDKLKDPSWSVAYGLSILGLESDDNSIISIKKTDNITKTIGGWFKKLLP